MTKSFAGRLALLGVTALAIRMIYILVIARAPVGVGGDAGFYHSAANQIADGHFYYRVIFGHAYATAEHPPLYSLLLSLISLPGGVTIVAHRVVGCVVGSFSVLAIGLLAGREFGERAGLTAAALAALYPPFVTADGLVMSEPLFVLTVTIALLVAQRVGGPWSVRRSTLLGIVIGLATLTRSEGLLLLPLLAWPVVWSQAKGRTLRLGAVTAAAALVLVPWIAHNLSTFHRVELASDASAVIAGANCQDTYYGHDIGWWSLDCLARARSHAQLLAGDASAAPGVHYAGHHVARLPLVAAVRVLRTFDLYQPLRQGNREPRRRWVDILGLVFYFPVLVLAAIGFSRMRDRRWMLLAPVWMALIVSVFGWGIGRFRVAADVSLIVLAASVVAARRAARA